MTKKTKILFTHNTAMWYRIPFFRQLSKIYDLDLTFTHMDVIKDVYDTEVTDRIEGLEDVNYTILKNSHGFARGLIKKSLSNTDVVIGGSWDSIQELTETVVLHTVAAIRKKPFIIWREDWDWQKKDTLKEKILEKIIKYLSNHADAILVPGLLHREYFQNKIGIKGEKIFIMPNVSNISGYDENCIKTKTRTVLYVGRLIVRKGVKYLLEAYKDIDLEDTQLVIIGTGPEEDNLKQYVRDNKIRNVTFTGKIENDKLKKYYAESSLTVIPSINEGMADPWVFVLNEAMYYSNAVIATNAVGAGPDMIKDNGYIVEERNSRQLKEAMNKILTDDSLRKKMCKKSRKIIENEFQYHNMTDGFNKAIEYVKQKKDVKKREGKELKKN